MLTAGRGEVTIDVRKPCVIHNSRNEDSILSKSFFGGVDEVREAGIVAKSNPRQVPAAAVKFSSSAAAVPLMATLLQGDETRDEESLAEEKDDDDDETTCGEESEFLIRLLGRLPPGSAATVAA